MRREYQRELVLCPDLVPNSSGFELIDLEPSEEERGVVAQPSPPISVKSSSSNNTVHGVDELSASSPDSGYGNTPEYINAARSTDSEGKVHRQPSEAVNECAAEERVRGDTETTVFPMEPGGGQSPLQEVCREAPYKACEQCPWELSNA